MTEYLEELLNLKNARGKRIIAEKWARGFNLRNAPLEDLISIFSRFDEDGRQFLRDSEVYNFLNDGISSSELNRIVNLQNTAGEYLVQEKEEVSEIEPHNLDYIEKVTSLTNSEGKPFINYELYFQSEKIILSTPHYLNIIAKYQNFSLLEELSQITTIQGTQFFNDIKAIQEYAFRNIDTQKAIEIASIELDDESLFKDVHVETIQQLQISKSYIQRLLNINIEGNQFFQDARTILNFAKVHYNQPETAEEFARLRNKEGDRIFTESSDLVLYLKNSPGKLGEGVGLLYDYVNAGIQNGHDIAVLKQAGLTPEQVKKYNGLTASEIIYFEAFGTLNFTFDKKPKALVILPKDDPHNEHHYGVFRGKDAVDMIGKMRAGYDMQIRIASTNEDVKKHVEEAGNLDLLVLSGHGSQNALILGDENIIAKKTDIKYLDKVNANGVIFLFSCLNGAGGKHADNLANYVAQNARRRKIFSCQESFEAKNVRIINSHPLRLEISNYGSIGYVAKMD